MQWRCVRLPQPASTCLHISRYLENPTSITASSYLSRASSTKAVTQEPDEDATASTSQQTYSGLVRSIRKHKKVAFAQVSDTKSYHGIQAVLRPHDAEPIQNGAYVELRGQWQKSLGGKQSHELVVQEVTRLGESDAQTSPIQKKTMSVDHLRSYPHLRLRIPLYALLARARSQVIASVHDFYSGSRSSETGGQTDEAVFVQPPLITSSDCEGAGETFTIAPKTAGPANEQKKNQPYYFRTPKYLTVSAQLHLEAFAAELGNVWTLSPTFRAEESDTARHLSEFWMLEAEFRGPTSITEVTTRVQRLIQHIVSEFVAHPVSEDLLSYYADDKHRSETNSSLALQQRWNALLSPEWQKITYTEAISALQEATATNADLFRYAPNWDTGLQLEHERWIVENLAQNSPVFVTHYPRAIKPFYMLDSDPHGAHTPGRETVACFDLLLPNGTCEVAGGSLRHHDLAALIQSMREKGLLAPATKPTDSEDSTTGTSMYSYLQPGESLNTLQWYADLRCYGTSPHGGFGLGFDRLLMHLTGIPNVRDIVPFPRTWGVAHC